MKALANYSQLRWTATILLGISLIWFLFQNQKGIQTKNEGVIFYFQGEPGSFFLVLFACTIAVYFFTFTKKDWSCLLKRWILLFNTCCFFIMLPLQVYSMDSYFYLSDKGVVESSFWSLQDEQRLTWQQLKKVTLSIWGDEQHHSISHHLYFAQGKTYQINLSSMGKEKFLRFVRFLQKQSILLEMEPLTEKQQTYILKNYGSEMLQLWQSEPSTTAIK